MMKETSRTWSLGRWSCDKNWGIFVRVPPYRENLWSSKAYPLIYRKTQDEKNALRKSMTWSPFVVSRYSEWCYAMLVMFMNYGNHNNARSFWRFCITIVRPMVTSLYIYISIRLFMDQKGPIDSRFVPRNARGCWVRGCGLTGPTKRNQGSEHSKESAIEMNWSRREMMELRSQADDAKEFVDTVKEKLSGWEIYVLTPDGAVRSLAKGFWTDWLFAYYEIHTKIGKATLCMDGRFLWLPSWKRVTRLKSSPIQIIWTKSWLAQYG